jgi:hypothetical protein
MATSSHDKWLLLIHQLPPEPNALRVKIWRRLQQVGAVAIKPSVYVMPACEHSLEDLNWTLREIVDGGGDGSISEVRFKEGLNDDQVIALFQNARKADYGKIIQEANLLLTEWAAHAINPQDPATKAATQVARLQRRFDEVAAIDFFRAPERGTAELLIRDLSSRLAGESAETGLPGKRAELRGKTWVTRRNIFVDRIACGWLIRRFVEEDADIQFVDPETHAAGPNEVRFDMFEGDFTHEGEHCTFEVMVQRLGLGNPGLGALSEVIHDIDLKDAKYRRAETDGVKALLNGLAAAEPDDGRRLNLGMQLMDHLYAHYRRQKAR